MARYYILSNGQKYKVSMSDITDYTIMDKPAEDIIHYTVNVSKNTISAQIINPSQHTLYLISQGRCFLGINKKMTHKWCFYGNPGYGKETIYRLGQRERHPYWAKSDTFVKIKDVNDITISFNIGDIDYQDISYLNDVSDYYKDPQRENYYIIFKPILISAVPIKNRIYIRNPNARVYSTNSQETTLTYNRE